MGPSHAPRHTSHTDLNLNQSLRHQSGAQKSTDQELSVKKTVAKLDSGFAHLARYVHGYERVMAQTKLALATANHHLIIGPTGFGKSYYVRGVLGLFKDDVVRYETQITLETTEDQIYGYIPFENIKDGTSIRNLTGSVVMADIAFLDEVFDGRDDLLRSLLWPLAERRYKNGNEIVEANLHTVLACGNYTRVNQKTEAFLDRFLFQSVVAPKLGAFERQAILRDKDALREIPALPPDQRISIAELELLTTHVDQLELSHTVGMYLDAIVATFDESAAGLGVSMSARTFKQLGRIVKANALLHGSEQASLEDLSSIALVLSPSLTAEHRDLYRQAYANVMSAATPGEINVVKTLGDLALVVDAIKNGTHIAQLTLPEHIMTYLGITTETRLSFKKVLRAIGDLKQRFKYFQQYQSELVSIVKNSLRSSGKQEDDLIP